MLSRLGIVRIAGLAIVAATLGGSAMAFTAGNSGPGASTAGYSSSAASGVTITDLKYNLDSSDISKIASVQFDVTGGVPSGAVVTVQIGSAIHDTGSIGGCSDSSGTITCAGFSGTTVASILSVGITVAQ